MFALLRRLLCDARGNIAIILAVALLPLVFLLGMAIDYTIASDRQARLDAFADAAALAAVTPTMMAQNDSIAAQAAQNTFNAQASALTDVAYNPSNLAVSVHTTSGGVRTATVSYTAATNTFFSQVVGASTINLSGSSTATAGLPPNIDFYLMLDDSPSMAIAATPAGIQTMVNNTASQGGCAFGCHEQAPWKDNLGNPGGEDNYQLARNLGVTLRIDLLREAAQNLMATAQSTENLTVAKYGMAIYTFDVGFNTIQALTANLGTAQAAAGNISQLEVYANNYLTASVSNSDTDTNFDAAFSGINAIMPNPGSGTNAAGDTPQEVLFLVTDGVEDEMVAKPGGVCPTIPAGSGTELSVNGSKCRQESLINLTTDWCTTIKNRGIRIAVLYTVYLPLPTNAWYNANVAPYQAQVGPVLQACASPGLYYEVESGGDISAALSNLFQLAVQSAYLSK